MKIVLVSTYELGHQPFGLASPAAWLREAGHEVTCADLSRDSLPNEAVSAAGMVAFFLPMHTATRLALRVVPRVRALNPRALLCGYGLYAPLNAEILRECGVTTVVGGEFEQGLLDLAGGRVPPQPVSLDRLRFRTPDRAGLPPLERYAQLNLGGRMLTAGYTEASRGCKHLCRHCPVVPVYNGAFRVVQQEAVLEDIRRQAEAGARHITFGDPDFFNGPGHAAAIVEAFHAGHPELTYDATIKIEHLLQRRDLLPLLKRTGCLFVTSAVESVDDGVLRQLRKGHTRQDFYEAVRIMREAGLALAPTFVPFTPWTTAESYRELLRVIAELDLVEQVAPVQLAIRLLIPQGSLMLELPEIQAAIGPFDPRALVYPWKHADPALDELPLRLQDFIRRADGAGAGRRRVFAAICEIAGAPLPTDEPRVDRAAIPYLTEPWYC